MAGSGYIKGSESVTVSLGSDLEVTQADQADLKVTAFPVTFEADGAPDALTDSSSSLGQITEGTVLLLKADGPFHWVYGASGGSADTDDTPVMAYEVAQLPPAPAAPNNYLHAVCPTNLSCDVWTMTL